MMDRTPDIVLGVSRDGVEKIGESDVRHRRILLHPIMRVPVRQLQR
jgi:hypothetical protein